MSDRINHAAEARRVLGEGERTVAKIRKRRAMGDVAAADDYGKKAAGCWAQAQVHATLALVEQQRIANLIALSEHQNPPLHLPGALRDDVREGLGL